MNWGRWKWTKKKKTIRKKKKKEILINFFFLKKRECHVLKSYWIFEKNYHLLLGHIKMLLKRIGLNNINIVTSINVYLHKIKCIVWIKRVLYWCNTKISSTSVALNFYIFIIFNKIYWLYWIFLTFPWIFLQHQYFYY